MDSESIQEENEESGKITESIAEEEIDEIDDDLEDIPQDEENPEEADIEEGEILPAENVYDEDNDEDFSDENSLDEEDLEESSKSVKTDKQETKPNKILQNINFRGINLEEEDSIEFLQKFDSESKKDYIIANHNECLNKNFNEIKNLLVVKKNSNNIIIDEFHKSIPILTKYEKTKIIGIRVKQLNNGSKPFISISENIIDNFIIANKELELKKLPFIIERPMPNNVSEYWKLQDLEIL